MTTLNQIKETSDNIKQLLNNPLENIVKIIQLNNSLSILIDRLIKEQESGEDSNIEQRYISKAMAKFLCVPEDETIRIVDASLYIHEYIKKHNLQDSNNQRRILPNKHLKTILINFDEEKEELTYFNLSNYIKKNLINEPII